MAYFAAFDDQRAARVSEAIAAAVAGGGGAGTNTATDRLVAMLRNARALLLLDNCEHVVEPLAALVNTLVASCPRVTILITSREGLFVPGEQIFRLAPLPVLDAVRLFAERARAQGPFVLDESTQMVVAAICARLDGIPLAIEMAVPRLKVLSPAQLAERLDERFRFLGAPGRGATPRHRTLQAMIDWSYDHLSSHEQVAARFGILGSRPRGHRGAVRRVDDVALLDQLTRRRQVDTRWNRVSPRSVCSTPSGTMPRARRPRRATASCQLRCLFCRALCRGGGFGQRCPVKIGCCLCR